MEKKRYHVVRKQQADTKALLRVLVSVYLFYLGYRLISRGDGNPVFYLAGGIFMAGSAAFGWFTWRQYRAALRQAELTPGEEEALRQDQDPQLFE